MLGLLAFFWIPIIIGAVISAGAATANVLYARHQANKAKEAAEKQALKQERKAKVMHLKEFNRALAAYNTGALLAKRDLIQAKRERAYHLGKTVS